MDYLTKQIHESMTIDKLKLLGGYCPLLAITRQPPETAYAVPTRIVSQSVLTLLARHGMIAELRLPAALNLVFD